MLRKTQANLIVCRIIFDENYIHVRVKMKFPIVLLRSQILRVGLVLACPLEQGSNSLVTRSGQELKHIRQRSLAD